jgi:large subunit ribosomal protein L1
MVRGQVQLPNGSGKNVRIVAFTRDPQVAIEAGACDAGLVDLIEKIKDGWMDFDVATSTVECMKEVKSLARLLGPKGLMPSTKAGTVTDDLVTCINELKRGRVEFKMDKTANVQLGIGKCSFGLEKLFDNAMAALEAIRRSRPSAFRGKLVHNGAISSTMSPSLLLETSVFAKF